MTCDWPSAGSACKQAHSQSAPSDQALKPIHDGSAPSHLLHEDDDGDRGSNGEYSAHEASDNGREAEGGLGPYLRLQRPPGASAA